MLSVMFPNVSIVELRVTATEKTLYNFKFLRDGGSCHHIIEVNSNRKNIFYTAARYQGLFAALHREAKGAERDVPYCALLQVRNLWGMLQLFVIVTWARSSLQR